jgi:hypothetical protein
VGLAVAVAAVALGLTLSRSDPGVRQASCGPTAPKLSVVGTGQATVTPDLLTVVVQVDAGGPSAAAALATDNADAARALSTFEGGGVQAKDIATSGLSLQPQYEYPKGVPTLTGYEVDNTVTATLRDISKSGAIIDAVVGSAGNALQIESIGFSSADPRIGQDRARASAAAQAQAHARALARAAGRSLGPVCTLTDQSAAVEPGGSDLLGPADPDGSGFAGLCPRAGSLTCARGGRRPVTSARLGDPDATYRAGQRLEQ